MVSVLRTLQAEWNALVPQAQALNIRRVRTLNLPLETIDYRRNKLEWLRSEIARLTATTALTPILSPDLSMFTFGVELEFILGAGVSRDELARRISAAGINCTSEGYNHTTGSNWKITTDGSVDPYYVSGFEIVSPILRGDDGFRQTQIVCDILKNAGCKVNKKCGLHVHVGASDWQLPTFKNLMLLYKQAEPSIDSFMAPSRRLSNNGFARSLRINTAQLAAAHTMDDVARACGQTPGRAHVRGSGRYYKINLQSYWQHGTVEFRHHQGTIEADKVINWTKLCLRMCLAARQGTAVADTFDAFFAAVAAPDDEKAFFQGRANFFAQQLNRSTTRANSLAERGRRARFETELLQAARAEGTVTNVFDETASDLQRRSTTRGQI